MADISVSYSSEDPERVKPLVSALEEIGWSVWWDRELVAGPSYEDKFEESLDEARSVVVVWSNQDPGSRFLNYRSSDDSMLFGVVYACK